MGLGYNMGYGVYAYGLGVHSLSHGGAWVALDVSIGYWSCLLLGGAAGAVYIGCWLVMKLALNGIQDSGRAVDFFVIFFNEIIKAAAPPAWPPGAPQSPRELHTRTCPHRTSKFIQICVGFNSSRRTSSYKWLPSRRSAPRWHRRRRRHGGSQIRKAIHK